MFTFNKLIIINKYKIRIRIFNSAPDSYNLQIVIIKNIKIHIRILKFGSGSSKLTYLLLLINIIMRHES